MAPSFTTRSSSYHERLGVLPRWRQLARQFAVGAEVLEVFDFEFRGDGHRNPGPVWYRGGPGPRVPAGCAVEVRTGGPGPECRSWRASRGAWQIGRASCRERVCQYV